MAVPIGLGTTFAMTRTTMKHVDGMVGTVVTHTSMIMDTCIGDGTTIAKTANVRIRMEDAETKTLIAHTGPALENVPKTHATCWTNAKNHAITCAKVSKKWSSRNIYLLDSTRFTIVQVHCKCFTYFSATKRKLP